MEKFGITEHVARNDHITLLEPLPYVSFMNLVFDARCVITDSGGLQEETTFLDIPCLTLRENTERPITVDEGTSTLIGSDAVKLQRYLKQVLQGTYKVGHCPKLWDGKAAQRIAEIVAGS